MKKLKGTNVKKIPVKKRKKMEKTLARMDKARQEDNIQLREILKTKLDWAIKEIKKGKDLIAEYQKKIHKTTIQVYKLDGIIIAMRDILTPQKEDDSDKSKA